MGMTHITPETAPLTRREYDIALMVADGLTHREIAQRCYRSTSTIKNQLSSVYVKLQIRDPYNKRAALARWIWERENR